MSGWVKSEVNNMKICLKNVTNSIKKKKTYLVINEIDAVQIQSLIFLNKKIY